MMLLTRPRMQQLHTYAGLQACAGLLVYGLTTLIAGFAGSPFDEAAQRPVVTEQRLSLPDELRTAPPPEVAEAVTKTIQVKLLQGPWLAREEAGEVAFLLGGPGGSRKVRYRRSDQRLTISLVPASTAQFVSFLHQVRPPVMGRIDPWLFGWGLFNLLSAGSLLFLVVSGSYLFLTTKRKPWYAWLVAGAATATVLATLVMGLG